MGLTDMTKHTVGELVYVREHIMPVGIGTSGIAIKGWGIVTSLYSGYNYVEVMMPSGHYIVSMLHICDATLMSQRFHIANFT